jgi:hypothetical protein
MNASTVQDSTPSPAPGESMLYESTACELDSLLSAISEAIEALKQWNVTAFQAAVDRQSAICGHLTLRPECHPLPGTVVAAKKVRELNRVYDRLLQHSLHWTRTMHSILEAGGHSYHRRASVHFRG